MASIVKEVLNKKKRCFHCPMINVKLAKGWLKLVQGFLTRPVRHRAECSISADGTISREIN